MKNLKLLILAVILLATNRNIFGQTNLILNPGFEDGSIPSNPSGIAYNLATHWGEIGFPYYYPNGDPNPSVNTCNSYTSDLLDTRSSNCQVKVPKNDWGNLNVRSSGNRYVSFSGGNWEPVPSTNPTKYRFKFGETISGKFDGTIQYGCPYTISFWAANTTKVIGNCTQSGGQLKPGLSNYNKIDVVLRKSSTSTADCKDYIVVWTSPNITSTSWTQFTGTFSITYADFLKGYDRIDFRFTTIPENQRTVNTKINASRRIYLDDVSLTAQTTYTATPSYTFNNLNVTTATTWNNLSVELQGTTTLNSNLTISGNSKVRLADNAKIVVKSGKKLTITSSTLEGMCNMWDKIEVENGGEVSITGSNIYDMRNGVRVNGASSKYTITTSNFDRNFVSVYLFQTNMVSTSSSITSNNFYAKQALKDKAITKTGFGQYGMRIVTCSGTTTIGSSTGGNTFEGSTYGIWIEDSKTELKYNYFLNHKEVGVMCFNGYIVPLSGNKNAYISYANNNKELIAQHNIIKGNKIGLEIRGRADNADISGDNKFQFNAEYGVKVSLAKGSQGMRVGRDGNSAGGTENSFHGNGIAGIYLYDNGSTIKNTANFLVGNTDILIGKNNFTSSVNAAGILIEEPVKGSNKIFQRLDIVKNTFNNIGTAIKYSNTVGNNGEVVSSIANQNPANNYSSTNDTRLFDNIIYYNSQNNPTVVGIDGKNSVGVQILKNGITNSVSQQWQNKAIWTDFAENTLIRENNCNNAGYGLNAGGMAMSSNYHCNAFSACNTGIHLNFHTLRNTSDVHGKLNASGNYSRHNSFINNFSWGTGIHVYNSQTNKNSWIFETGKPLPKITYAGATGSIVNSNTGSDGCLPPNYFPPFNPDNGTSGGVTQLDAFTNSYRIESYYVNNDSVLIGTYNAVVAKLIKVENLFREGNYTLASSLIDSVTPLNLLDSNYKVVLEELVSTRPDDTTINPVDSLGIIKLSSIASQNVQVGGPAVYLARAILKYEENLEFDTEDFKVSTLTGQLFDLSPCSDSLDALPISLIDNQGNIAPIPPVYTSLGGNFALDPVALGLLDSSKLYGFIIPFPSNYSIKNTEFKYLNDWSNETSINIEVMEVIPSITIDSIVGYSSDTLVTDSLGNIYQAITVFDSAYTDIALVKKDSTGTELWRRYYRGWAGLADSANMILLDSIGNIYVVGTTKDSTTTNAITLKYNADGGIEMAQIFKDSLGSDTKITGIKVNEYGHIYVNCLLGTSPIELTYLVCNLISESVEEPGGGEGFVVISSAQEANTEKTEPVVYPNPNKGLLNIQIAEEVQDAEFKLFNLAGMEIFTSTINSKLSTFNVGKLNDGVYIYTLHNKATGKISRGKIVLNK